MTPSVSVIVPCYNHGAYLRTACDSVMVQSSGDVELVIVNDSSTDNTADVCKSVAEETTAVRVRVVKTKQQVGLGAARNIGIQEADGEYIVPLDADDFLNPAYVALVKPHLDSGKADIVSCGRINCGLSNQAVNIAPIVPDLLPVANQLGYCSMFRKRCWEQVGGYSDNAGREGYEDWEFWMKCALANFTFTNVPQLLWYHRELPGSMAKKAIEDDEYLRARIVTRLPQMYSQDSIKRAFMLVEEGAQDGMAE